MSIIDYIYRFYWSHKEAKSYATQEEGNSLQRPEYDVNISLDSRNMKNLELDKAMK